MSKLKNAFPDEYSSLRIQPAAGEIQLNLSGLFTETIQAPCPPYNNKYRFIAKNKKLYQTIECPPAIALSVTTFGKFNGILRIVSYNTFKDCFADNSPIASQLCAPNLEGANTQ